MRCVIVTAVAILVLNWSALNAQQHPAGSNAGVDRTTDTAATEQIDPAASSKDKAPTSTTRDGIKDALEMVETVFQIVAYLVAGGWVYFNFFKGRTYRPRLELRVQGQLARATKPQFVIAILQVKNVGLSKVDVSKEGTAFRFLVFDPAVDDQWRHITTLPLLQAHQWIEPSEALEEQALLPLALDEVVAVRIEAIITGPKTMWETFTIVV